MSTPPPPYHPVHQPTSYRRPDPGPAPSPLCQVCGAAPAAFVTVRGHQGMVVLMRFLRQQGVYCRPCGTATFREMQANTLLQGWWGPLSLFITPVTLLMNLGARSTLLRLPEPTTWGARPPLDPGEPLSKRPVGVIALLPLVLLAVGVIAVSVLVIVGMTVGDSTSEPLTVGSCARNAGSWSDQDLRSEPCGSSDAQFRVVDPKAEECELGDYVANPEYSGDGTTSYCLRPLN